MAKKIADNWCASVGGRLASIRKELGLSQNEFAAQVGASLRAYQNYERGESEVSAAVIRALYSKFRIRPVWILEGGEEVRERSADNADLLILDEKLFLVVLDVIEEHVARNRLEVMSASKMGKLAMIVCDRVAGVDAKQQYEAVVREVAQVIEILESGQSALSESAAKTKIKQLFIEYIKLEVASTRAFIDAAALYDPDISKRMARDIGSRKDIEKRAQWMLREQLLIEKLIGYDSHSVEHFVPTNMKRCVAWLESQCAKQRSFLKEMKAQIAESAQPRQAHRPGKNDSGNARKRKAA